MRAQPLLAMGVALSLLIAPYTGQRRRPVVVWNISPSVSTGPYWVGDGRPRVGDLVLVRLPPRVATIAARRGYLPRSVPLLKPVAAIGGERVCRFGPRVFVARRLAAVAFAVDGLGRSMPVWQGCQTLRFGEVFALADHPASFDSRYFGPLGARSIAGRGVCLWPRGSER